MMNLMHWRMLVAVADTGNITRAAERVGMTQSGASQALALLEDNLGVQLFTRENRQTLPTAVGEQVVEQARLMLEALQNIRDTADACRDIQRGTIRLASFPMVLATFLPPLLRRFKQLYPGIQVVALEVSDDEVEALLEARLIDIGVLLNPAPERSVGLLGRDAWVAVLPAGHALVRRAQEQGVTLQELVSQPFVLATGGCSVNARSLAADAGLELADVRVEVREWNSAFTLVREQVGVTLVPQMTLPEQRHGLCVLPLDVPIPRTFALVLAEGSEPSPALRALLDMLAQG
ncbi:Transcriptional regulator, LysR family [Pseudomonas chlororaphis subsp. aureofaciens]|uniref:Transcriptional regulator, LysR family n=1 Tax=Pseudomonas chlororaphis subsp. aureofaciens TaxID=587851 RepID=A0AAD0ZLX6_9PSED|nr:LysR family transcriptional regulator [Pseudomonas chlororaphis]AZE25264.1 Transcriptional regulator, LysR family [Pseudomonas chlororaphis subsp. aureofaciens]AZE31464.1 Transcriptional regulator, LysR family [Pseudomonas chlororaphis subsp. aureofaciens]AZE44178.1 Transcriptional regulator, LysR family [Pseudomonas chlororaphis subsp. aureofaciens]QHC91226.1 LysR family transcriptional regulator [Pseudomonas chlororaphis]